MGTVFWVFKKEILKQSQGVELTRFCFQFTGDSGNSGYIDYVSGDGSTQRLDGNFDFQEVVSVYGTSIVGYSSNFEPTTC